MTREEYEHIVHDIHNDRSWTELENLNWNDTYLNFLDSYGLELSTIRKEEWCIMGPEPTLNEPNRWPKNSYIVPKEG